MPKRCSRCGATKELNEFPRAHTCIDGTRSYCKDCDKKRKTVWRWNNKEKHNAKCRAWAEANREKRKEIQRNSREKHKSSGKAKEAKRAWRKRNPELARALVSYRRRKLKQATPPWVDKNELLAIYIEAQRTGLSVDHIIPLQHAFVCGLHVPWNLALVSLKENSSKQNLFSGVRTRSRKKEKVCDRQQGEGSPCS